MSTLLDTATGPDSVSSQDTALTSLFFDLLHKLEKTSPNLRQELVNAWLYCYKPDFPFVENDLATFLFLGEADRVTLAGDMNGWNDRANPLYHEPDTNLFHLTYELPRDARLDYKFVVDGNWILDPRNPLQIPSGFGPNSELRMPGWAYPMETEYDCECPHGAINGVAVGPSGQYPPHQHHSESLGNRRNCWVYLPPGYSENCTYPSLIVQDGQEYMDIAGMPFVLDNLLAQGAIPPLIVLFVAPVDRIAEYVGEHIAGYVELIVKELVPWLDSKYATVVGQPQQRGIMGTSNGGYISARIGRDHPEVFGLIGSQSGALLADGGSVIQSFARREVKNSRIYLDCGLVYDFVGANSDMREALESGGYTFWHEEYPEGHSWGNWRARQADLLRFLFPS